MITDYQLGVIQGFKEAFIKQAQNDDTPGPMGRKAGLMTGGALTGALLGGASGGTAGKAAYQARRANMKSFRLAPGLYTKHKYVRAGRKRGAIVGALGGALIGNLADKAY